MATAESALDWRTAKKAATRARIRESALGLFREHGFDQTTVEQIAEAAGVTHTTFFRYFPTKEDVVLSDEHDPLIIAAIREQASDLAPIDRLCTALVAGSSRLDARHQRELLEQMKLILVEPALRQRLWERQIANQQTILEAFEAPDRTFELEVIVGAVYAAATIALIDWARRDAVDTLATVLARAFDALRTSWGSTRLGR